MFLLLLRRPSSNASTEAWTLLGLRKISVEPHQIMIRRLARDFFLKLRMSSRSCSARSILFLPFLTLGPFSFLT